MLNHENVNRFPPPERRSDTPPSPRGGDSEPHFQETWLPAVKSESHSNSGQANSESSSPGSGDRCYDFTLPESTRTILNAIRHYDQVTLEKLVASQADIVQGELCALAYATSHGNVGVVDLLVRNGASCSGHSSTPNLSRRLSVDTSMLMADSTIVDELLRNPKNIGPQIQLSSSILDRFLSETSTPSILDPTDSYDLTDDSQFKAVDIRLPPSPLSTVDGYLKDGIPVEVILEFLRTNQEAFQAAEIDHLIGAAAGIRNRLDFIKTIQSYAPKERLFFNQALRGAILGSGDLETISFLLTVVPKDFHLDQKTASALKGRVDRDEIIARFIAV